MWMSPAEFTEMALSFDGTLGQPHFDRTAFKVITKRIFATLQQEQELANIKLPIADQLVFCSLHKSIFPVPNKWGDQGWTSFEIRKVERHIILDALSVAYGDVIKRKIK